MTPPPAPPSEAERLLTLHIRDKRNLCGSGALIGLSPDGRTLRVVPLLCHRWDCQRCGPLKAAAWRRRIMLASPTRWLTLTHKPRPSETQLQAMDDLQHDFSKLVQRIRKRWGSFSYVRVLELTKSGQPHFHVVYNGSWISQKWLSLQWAALNRSPIVHIGRLKSEANAVRYISKYLTKLQSTLPTQSKHVRVITCSRDWPKDAPLNPDLATPADFTWTRVKHLPWVMIEGLLISPLQLVSINKRTWSCEFSGTREDLSLIHLALIRKGTVPDIERRTACGAKAPRRRPHPRRAVAGAPNSTRALLPWPTQNRLPSHASPAHANGSRSRSSTRALAPDAPPKSV